MDKDIAIRVEGLGKKYTIGHESADRTNTLRDAIVRGAGNFSRMGKAMLRGQPIVAGDELEEFWALRGMDFEIRRGDVVGVIGRNGAGKSTLLKVLSRITEPSEGRVSINGRVASLLEVGTGFHPELSGRENIFLNGAILGMSRAEIRRKFDEIVAFSEVEKFLDTPVKRYSSGMYVRLAFAVAAHLEPEILIVDEVLAVGDAEFQKKCLGKMQDVAGEGRTVLFVSHNIASIQALCRSGIHLQAGQIRCFDEIPLAIDSYSRENATIAQQDIAQISKRYGLGNLRFSNLEFIYPEGRSAARTRAPLKIRVALDGKEDISFLSGRVSVAFHTKSGQILFDCPSRASYPGELEVGPGQVFELVIPSLPLSGGDYIVSLYLARAGQDEDFVEIAANISVDDAPYFPSSYNVAPGWEGKLVLVDHGWSVVRRFRAAK